MSETIEIHHGVNVPNCNPRYPGLITLTEAWAEVTCGPCKLERPLELPREYVVPESVKRSDQFTGAQTFLAETMPAAAQLQRELARAKELEEGAVRAVSEAARFLADTSAARKAIEDRLSALLPGGQGSGVHRAGSVDAKPSQGLSARGANAGADSAGTGKCS